MSATVRSLAAEHSTEAALHRNGLWDALVWRDAAIAWLAQHAVLAVCFRLALFSGVRVPQNIWIAVRVLLIGWDGRDLAAVATHGYVTARDAAFFPLLPLAEHVMAPLLGGRAALAGWLLANIAALGAFGVLRRLAEDETGSRRVARLALVFLAFSPFAVFLSLAYTEPVFLLLALLTFHALRHRRWLTAGLMLALAVLTRMAGIVLLVPLALEAVLTLRARFERETLIRAAGAAALPVLALSGFWLFLAHIYGTPFAGARAENTYWTRHLDWPWYGVVHTIGTVIHPADGAYVFRAALDLAALAVASALSVALAVPRVRAWAGVPFSYAAYAWAATLFALCVPLHPTDGSDALFSLPRYLLVAFPFAILLGAVAGHSRRGQLALQAATLLGYALLTVLYAAGVGIG
jgi:hypothetical protein